MHVDDVIPGDAGHTVDGDLRVVKRIHAEARCLQTGGLRVTGIGTEAEFRIDRFENQGTVARRRLQPNRRMEARRGMVCSRRQIDAPEGGRQNGRHATITEVDIERLTIRSDAHPTNRPLSGEPCKHLAAWLWLESDGGRGQHPEVGHSGGWVNGVAGGAGVRHDSSQ